MYVYIHCINVIYIFYIKRISLKIDLSCLNGENKVFHLLNCFVFQLKLDSLYSLVYCLLVNPGNYPSTEHMDRHLPYSQTLHKAWSMDKL
jgi:hypothetical protein